MKRTILIAAAAAFILSSCVTFDEEATGVAGLPTEISGVTTRLETDKATVIVTATNDGDREVEITVRPENVIIGWSVSGKSSGDARAAWIMTPSVLYLSPGESGRVVVYLNNWYMTMQDFTATVEIRIAEGDIRRRVLYSIDQDNLFRDTERLYRENKTGKNRPERSPGVTVGVDGAYLTSSF